MGWQLSAKHRRTFGHYYAGFPYLLELLKYPRKGELSWKILETLKFQECFAVINFSYIFHKLNFLSAAMLLNILFGDSLS